MARWTCPACDREFGRPHQSHTCMPGNSVDRTFARHPPEYRATYDEIVRYLRTLGPVHEDAVLVGVFLKHQRKLAEVRPKAKWLSLEVMLPRTVEDRRVSRRIDLPGGRCVHIIRLFASGDVDDQVREWLTEAYDAAG